MYHKVCLLLALLSSASAISINPKLNFDDSSPSDPPLHKELLENITVECTSVGCNTTKNRTDNDITANILVRIKTGQVDQPSATTEEVPDVPVVLGYGGLSEQEKIDIERRRQQEVELTPEYNPPSERNYIQFKPSVVGLKQPNYIGEPEPGLFYPERYTNAKSLGWNGIPARSYHRGGGVPVGWRMCTCPPESQTRGNQWHRSSYTGPLVGSPGSDIDDKLAPLN